MFVQVLSGESMIMILVLSEISYMNEHQEMRKMDMGNCGNSKKSVSNKP